MKKQSGYNLAETTNPSLRNSILGAALFLLALVAILLLFGGVNDPDAITIVPAAVVAVSFLILGLWLHTQQVVIDDEGVSVKVFWRRGKLRWEEIVTCAVVDMNLGGGKPQRMIVLSTLPEEEIIDQRRLMHGSRKIEQDMRFQYSEARVRSLQHYLKRDIKVYSL